MKITREVKKQKAIELMNKLDIYKPYIVDYQGVKCHALFNWFVCQFYADDVYGRVEE